MLRAIARCINVHGFHIYKLQGMIKNNNEIKRKTFRLCHTFLM